MAKRNIFRVFIGILCVCWGTNAKAINTSPHFQQRKTLLDQEDTLLLGHNQTLNQKEQKVNDILMKMKMAEMESAFNDLNFPPAKNFLVAREEIEASGVFQMIQLMPKGAALHLHDGAAVSMKWIISELTYWDNLYMCYTQNNQLLMKFMATVDGSCYWQLVSEVRASYRTPEEFDQHLLGRLSIVTDNPEEKYPDINAVWSAFENAMKAINGVVKFRPAWEVFLYRLFLELVQDNVLYVELRTSLSSVYELDGTKISEEEAIVIYKEVSRRFKEDQKQHFFGNRLIYSPRRSWDVNNMQQRVSLAKKLKRSHPDYVVGFDVVGQEDVGAPLEHIIEPLLELSVGEDRMAVFYHAGETNWKGMRPDENLIDALMLNATRIGHGYAITKHPVAKKMAREKDVPLEVCPISNQVLMLISDLRNHPASALVSEGFPIIVSSDAPGLFGSKGLSYDFYEAFMALGGAKADLRFIKQLAINSIKYSSLNQIAKSSLMQMWQEKWNQFITTIISTDHQCISSQQCPATSFGTLKETCEQRTDFRSLFGEPFDFEEADVD